MSVSFSFADFLVVAVILISTAYAVWRGFLAETLSVFEWVAAAFACLYLGPYFIPLTHSLVEAWWLANLMAYAGVFLAVSAESFVSRRRPGPSGTMSLAARLGPGFRRGALTEGSTAFRAGALVLAETRRRGGAARVVRPACFWRCRPNLSCPGGGRDPAGR